MLATLVVKTVIINQYFNSLFRVGMHMKAQLVHMLYDKALRITEPAKAKHGVGGIVNLQSNDASKLWNLPSYIHVLWSGPLQIIICMALLVSHGQQMATSRCQPSVPCPARSQCS